MSLDIIGFFVLVSFANLAILTTVAAQDAGARTTGTSILATVQVSSSIDGYNARGEVQATNPSQTEDHFTIHSAASEANLPIHRQNGTNTSFLNRDEPEMPQANSKNASSKSFSMSPWIAPSAFTNHIGGSKAIDVSWLFPEREDLENGILRLSSNDTNPEQVMDRLQMFLKNSIGEISRSAAPHFIGTFLSLEISRKCMKSTLQMFDGVRNLENWALKMLDSNGFYAGGFMQGTFSSLGNYDMCINAKAESDLGKIDEEFTGQYCSVLIRPGSHHLPNRGTWKSGVDLYGKELERITKEFKLSELHKIRDLLMYRTALCVPSTCSKEDLQVVLNAVSRYTSILNIIVLECEVKQVMQKLDPSLIPWIVLLASVVAFVMTCTIVDICSPSNKTPQNSPLSPCDGTNNKQKPLFLSICESCSIIRNSKKLLSTKSSDANLNFLHGVRFFTISWIVLGHCYYVDPNLYGNTSEAAKLGPSLWFQPIGNATFSVDTFLFISGFLVVYLCLQRMHEQNGRFSYIAFYINRILRLMPAYLLVTAIYILLPELGSGPIWNYLMKANTYMNCKRIWWRNLLFINNFYSFLDQCSYTSWYLAVAFQFFLISPPIVSILYRKPALGVSILLFLTLLCSTLTGVLTFLWNLPPILLVRVDVLGVFLDYFEYMYMMPYNHASPYFLGMVLGYFMYRKREIKIKPVVNCFGWITSTALCLSAIYGVYPWNRGDDVPQEWAAIYAAFCRTAWSLGIAWIFFACFTGNGGLINSFLSSKLLFPLSRMTYCVYLLHYALLTLLRARSRSVIFFSNLDMFIFFASVLLASHLCAFFCTILFESPFLALQKVLQSKVNQSAKLETKTFSNDIPMITVQSCDNQNFGIKHEPIPSLSINQDDSISIKL